MQTAYLRGTIQKVYSKDADKLTNEKFECTNCGSVMYLRNGAVRISHFYHKSLKSCDFSQSESEKKIKLKNEVFETLRKRYLNTSATVEMEFTGVPGCRADVFINGRTDKIAIEILVDVLDIRNIIEKTETYYTANIGVIWLLPFESNRIYSSNPGQPYSRFKMKEHEKILYFMNNKRLLFWNEKFNSITVAELDRIYSDDSEFYDKNQGSMVYYSGKTLRSTFEIARLHHNKYPENLKKSVSRKRFEMKSYKYPLPKSILWKYNPNTKT